jgi:glucose uptake protein GlcU
MAEKFLKIQWSLAVKIITFIALIIIIASEYYLINSGIKAKDWIMLIIASCILFICIYCVLETPRSIEINENEIILHKLMGKLVIALNMITNIEPYKPDKSEIRLLGSGGFWGFTGIFWNANIGKYRAFVGDFSQAFLIQTLDRKIYVLSCDNPAEIIEYVNNKRGCRT